MKPPQAQQGDSSERHVVFLLSGKASPTPANASVLVADIVGYTTLPTAARLAAFESLRLHLDRCPSYTRAKKVNDVSGLSTGDGFVLIFARASDATRCGLEFRDQVRISGKFEVRVGLHFGVVESVKDFNSNSNFIGEGIDVATRVASLADPGQFLASRAAFESMSTENSRLFARPVGWKTTKHNVQIELFDLDPKIRTGTSPIKTAIGIVAALLGVVTMLATLLAQKTHSR